MMPLNVLCIDDQRSARRRLESLLEEMPDVGRVRGAATRDEAVRLISEVDPHVVMVEAELEGGTAFDLLESLRCRRLPEVVFVASCDRHAVRAFDIPAIDYILKPAKAERLRTAIARVRSVLGSGDRKGCAAEPAGSDDDSTIEEAGDDLWVRQNGTTLVRVPISTIEHVTSAGDYLSLHAGGHEYRVRDSLSSFHRRLPPDEFARINRSALVRLSEIAEIRTGVSARELAVLRSGVRLTVGPILGRAALAQLRNASDIRSSEFALPSA